MKVLLVGDTPHLETGFSNQLKIIGEGCIKEGYTVCSIGFNSNRLGVSMYRPDWKLYSVKGTSEYYEIYHIILVEQPDVIVSLAELSWTMDYAKLPKKWRDRIINWVAVDCEPLNEPAVHAQLNFRKHVVFMADYGERIYGPYMEKMKHQYKTYKIYHGVDTDMFKPLDKLQCKIKHGVKDKFVALSVARNQWRKRPDLLLRAWAEFAKGKDDVQLIMHSEPVSVSQNLQTGYNLPYLIDRLGISNTCKMDPKLQCSKEELVELINAADVHCLFTMGEGFGVPLIETMACGVPNIATKCTTIPEIVDIHGIAVDPDSYDIQPDLGVDRPMISISGAVKALETMYDGWKKGLSTEVSTNMMREYIVNKYGNETIQSQWVNVINKVVQEEADSLKVVSNGKSILLQGSDNMEFSYAMVCKGLYDEFRKRGYDVEWCNYIVDAWNKQRDQALYMCYASNAHRKFDYHVRVSYPLDGKYMVGKKNINIVPYEWQTFPHSWVQESWNPNLDYVMPLSKNEESVFVKSGVPKEKVFGIQLGYDSSIYHSGVEKFVFKDMDPNSFVFLTLGSLLNLTSRKRTDLVLDAYTKEFVKGENVTLVIKTIQIREMRPFVDEIKSFLNGRAGFGKIVVLDSFMQSSTIASLYKAASVKVSPYIGEGWGITDLESMAVGTPVIATTGGGGMDFMDKDTSYLIETIKSYGSPPMYVDQKDTTDGWAVLNPSVDSLRKLMRRAYENRKELANKSEVGIERAKRFTWANAVNNFEAMVNG